MPRSYNSQTRTAFIVLLSALMFGCAIFHWDIHAPGLLSATFAQKIQPMDERVALYFSPDLKTFISKERGGKTADPQTYHVGEAYAPMLIESFQQAFNEFIFMEVPPTVDILKQYGIPYLVVTRIKDFGNRVTWKGQGLTLATESVVYDTQMNLLARFESIGVSDAQKIFAKKGGPQVNLNAALENNSTAIIQYLQDSITTKSWGKPV